MKPEYIAWIEAYVSSKKERFVRGKCREATSKMKRAFPELKRVCGFAHCSWGREQHFWLLTPEGEVVDPTLEQYAPFGVFEYEVLDLTKPEDRRKIPTGHCMDCGKDVYGGATFCNAECEEATRQYLEGPSIFPPRLTHD